MKPFLYSLLLANGLLFLLGCGTVKTEHTVHITMDINLKIEKELEDFFGDLDNQAEEIAEDQL
jgi:hypothetical protein|tara:strand:+ start:552 stop:740 length:189 start_codon:yes stop_codon:yes gene_type:complete